MGFGRFGFSLNPVYPLFFLYLDYPQGGGIFKGYRQGRDGDIGPLSNMKIDHLLQVHAVDMVGTENGDDVEVTILY